MELSTLCDAEIAVFVFSTSGKLFDYASTSTRQVIERRNLFSDGNLANTYQSSLELQAEGEHFKLNKELKEKTRESRQLYGEELQGLTLRDLRKLEVLLNTSLNRISKAKAEAFEQEISILKKEEARLMEENQRLNQEVKFLEENQRLEQVQRLEQDQDLSLLATSFTTRLLFR
ncbi:hypothetical protein QN277_014302 [Acacia crassicarpa]|uniref:Uncharacterized protein n=1 Tax=Acacia crassicarpa TaxID=499986 RepID=A0AAE1IMZ1_9FABA|nr:hypothetical protein QN277_014302 [Acacia crassicarpa]